MKVFIISFPFLLVSCVISEPENSSFSGRGKTEPRPRANINKTDNLDQSGEDQARAPAQTNNQTETNKAPAQSNDNKGITFVFPIEITDNLKSLKLESNDNKRIHISSTGGDMLVLAPQTGSLTVNSIRNQHHLEISIGKGRSLNLLFEKPKTSLKVNSKTKVIQRQLVAQTSSPITFYISKDGKDLILCLGDISASIPIINNLKEIETCNK